MGVAVIDDVEQANSPARRRAARVIPIAVDHAIRRVEQASRRRAAAGSGRRAIGGHRCIGSTGLFPLVRPLETRDEQLRHKVLLCTLSSRRSDTMATRGRSRVLLADAGRRALGDHAGQKSFSSRNATSRFQ